MLMDIDFKQKGLIEEYSVSFAMITFGVSGDKGIDVLIVVFVSIKNATELFDNLVVMLVLFCFRVKSNNNLNGFLTLIISRTVVG